MMDFSRESGGKDPKAKDQSTRDSVGGGTSILDRPVSLAMSAEESTALMESLARADAALVEEQQELQEQAADIYVNKFTEEIKIREKMAQMDAIMAQELEDLARQVLSTGWHSSYEGVWMGGMSMEGVVGAESRCADRGAGNHSGWPRLFPTWLITNTQTHPINTSA